MKLYILGSSARLHVLLIKYILNLSLNITSLCVQFCNLFYVWAQQLFNITVLIRYDALSVFLGKCFKCPAVFGDWQNLRFIHTSLFFSF